MLAPRDDRPERFWGPRLMWSALTAAMLGVIYALLTGWLKDAIGALPNSGSFSRGYGGGPLRLFLIVGGAGGWGMAIITERIWGWAGAVLFIPLLAQTLVASALAAFVAISFFGPLPPASVEMLAAAAIATLVAGGAKIYWESL